MSLLEIKNVHAVLEETGTEILKGISLSVNPGEVHAIMGANGSGKSTLANVLSGRDGYKITKGEVRMSGKDLLEMDPETRAREGLFLAFQYPVELPGVLESYFLRTALNAQRQYHGQEQISVRDFAALLKEKAKMLQLDESFIKRTVNEGFSGGEKKKNEIFQMAVLNPKLSILDETDSGLDIDALQVVAQGVNSLRRPDNATVVITHYQRLLNYIVPDYVHVLLDGKIVKSGGKELALELEARGYQWVREERA